MQAGAVAHLVQRRTHGHVSGWCSCVKELWHANADDAGCTQVVSLCGRLEREPGVLAAEPSCRVKGYASSPELQVRSP